MDAVNRTGQAFLSHTKLNGRVAIRVAISNLRTVDSDLELVWEIVRREAAAIGGGRLKKTRTRTRPGFRAPGATMTA